MDKEVEAQTWKEKLSFHTTVFFILLGTFSLFSFLFLVPFVIDPAFTTIFMDFDKTPATCTTIDTEERQGASNCSWSSCRERCTTEVYDCTQIRVNYKRGIPLDENELPATTETSEKDTFKNDNTQQERAIKNNYVDSGLLDYASLESEYNGLYNDYALEVEPTGLLDNNTAWYYVRAKLYPNVKGCGFTPVFNCSIFLKTYGEIGTVFSCYYSKVDPDLVISDLDLRKVYINLICAIAIPSLSFIITIMYLMAYFKIC